MQERRLWYLIAGLMTGLSLMWGACSGGMEESTATAATDEAALTSGEGESADEEATDNYFFEVGSQILDHWRAPGRDSNMPPREARVVVFLGPGGRVVRWEWRRRSPHGLFNDAVRNYLDGLVDSPRTYPLPPPGSRLRHRVMDQGILVDFADEDA